jgi:Ig-like domain-containing protein
VEEENMTATRKTKLLVWVAALALFMACVPTLATPAVPTVNPGAINTFIAQTVITPSLTPTQNTDTPEPTATNTVIFILSSPTSKIVPTFTALSSSGGSGSSSANYACQVTKVSPANGSRFNPRDDFDAVWTVKNIGQKKWDRTAVDYIYSSGDKFHKISGYDMTSNVTVGESIDLGVDMQAPKNSGTYTTTWTMRAGSKTFCNMTLTIVVK